MLAYSANDSSILTSTGQSVGRVLMCLDDVYIPVVTARAAAARLHVSVRHVQLLCDTDQLIAIKVEGRWWLHELSVQMYRASDRLSSQKTG